MTSPFAPKPVAGFPGLFSVNSPYAGGRVPGGFGGPVPEPVSKQRNNLAAPFQTNLPKFTSGPAVAAGNRPLSTSRTPAHAQSGIAVQHPTKNNSVSASINQRFTRNIL